MPAERAVAVPSESRELLCLGQSVTVLANFTAGSWSPRWVQGGCCSLLGRARPGACPAVAGGEVCPRLLGCAPSERVPQALGQRWRRLGLRFARLKTEGAQKAFTSGFFRHSESRF